MTLQTNAHPRLEPVFENGARRMDYDAVIELYIDKIYPFFAPVKDFFEFAVELDLPGVDYKQMARVLKQKADRGELVVYTDHGCYKYAAPYRAQPGEDIPF